MTSDLFANLKKLCHSCLIMAMVKIFSLMFAIGIVAAEKELLIKDFLEVKSSNGGIIISCDGIEDRVKMVKEVSKYGINAGVFDDAHFLKSNWMEISTPCGIVLDASCNGTKKVLDHASSLSMFRAKYKWLLITKSESDWKSNISDINLDSDVTLAVKTKHGYTLFVLHQLLNGPECGVLQTGTWSIKTGWILHQNNTENKKIDFHGRELIANAVIVGRPLEVLRKYLSNENDKANDSLTKDHYGILCLLENMYNFTIKYERSLSWGYYKNGTFDGMIGSMIIGRTDICASPIYLNDGRIPVTDIYAELRLQKVVVIFRHPKGSGKVQRMLIEPLEPNTWYAMLICLGIAFVTLTIAIYSCQYKKSKIIQSEKDDKSLSTLMMFIVGAISQQGYKDPSDTVSVRISLFSVLLFSMLLNQFYGASVVSSLLKEPPKTIKTPEDLLRSNLNLKAENLIYHKVYFATTTSEIVQQLYHKKILKGAGSSFISAIDGVKMVQKGGTGFYMDTDNGYGYIQDTFTMREICDLSEIQLAPLFRLYGALKKNSPYKEFFSRGYRKLYSGGITKRENQRWQSERPKCVTELTQNEFNVGFLQVSSAFFILGSGMVISIVLCLMEHYSYKHKMKASNRVFFIK